MSALIQTELAATCSSLGGMHGGKYVMEPQCYESVRDIVRYLRRDDEYHQVRRFLGEAKILQTDFIHIASNSTGELFDLVIRLLVSLTNPVMLLYKEELPIEKVGRNIYMNLVGFSQEYKVAFCDVKFWEMIRSKLTELIEVDWAERSEENSLQIERILVLLRNVLQVPADAEAECRPDNDITVHDKILWALRESQILELLLYLSSNKDEQQYYLHLLEIFSLMLREQNAAKLARCEIRRSACEKERDSRDLIELREKEKLSSRQFKNTRNFSPTFVVKNVKSISNNEVIYHKSLDKLNDLKLTQDKKRQKTPKNKFPVDSERPERSSTFSVRLFLKEFCIEFLACGFNNLMGVVKDKLVAGRGLPNDESYYFWALKFFLEFVCLANVEVKLVSECIKLETFHFTQTQIEKCYDYILTDKKRVGLWIKRLHVVLKAYRSLLQTLQWMDNSKLNRVRESSKILKSNLFYVVEYRELMLDCLLRFDPGKYPLSFLRDLIETNHLNLKLLEGFCKCNKIVIQKKKRIIKRSKKEKVLESELPIAETVECKWANIKDDIFDALSKKEDIPEIPPFDAVSNVPIDEQKGDAMKKVQNFLWQKDIKSAAGLLRSARQVWPENDIFGSSNMSVEEEIMVLQEICLADLGAPLGDPKDAHMKDMNEEANDIAHEEDNSDDEDEDNVEVIEQNFEITDYIKKLVNKKVVEGCCILAANYKRNTTYTNHCVIKLLHRISWECKHPAMLYQASFFVTLLKIMREKSAEYMEIKQFAKHLLKKFRENAASNSFIFMELLFWKDAKIAQDIEQGYGASDELEKKRGWSEEEEDELRKLWMEFEENMIDTDKIDWIKNNLINQNRSRISVIKKLKELMLLLPGTKVPKRKRGGKEWSEAEITELTELFNKYKDAIDTVTMIKDNMAVTRSKKTIKDKLLDLRLVQSLAELRKKKNRNSKKSVEDESEEASDDSDSEQDQENEVDEDVFSFKEAVNSLKAVEHLKEALEWVKETFEECLDEETGSDGYPLLAISTAHSSALDDSLFQEALSKIGFIAPKDDQVYWNMRAMSTLEVNSRIELISNALKGIWPELHETKNLSNKKLDSDESEDEDQFDKLKKIMSTGNKHNELSLIDESQSKENKISSYSRRVRNEEASSDSEQETDPANKNRPQSSKRRFDRKAVFDSSDSEAEIEVARTKSLENDRKIDSEVSDQGDRSDEETNLPLAKKVRRPTCLASDSEGEETPAPDPWRFKRRRCIGSDSELEENPSDDDLKDPPREARKKTKLLDSDSEIEGHGSMDEADISKPH